MIELLSPAGSLESGLSAFQYGADAVYLGLHSFSARNDAVNFSFDDLASLLGVAHRDSVHPRKVYAAVNTLARQSELDDLVDLLGHLSETGIDGVIIQDWAVYSIIRRYFPTLQIHASTQLAVHSYEGALRARELGFSRIVLARELSVSELERIASIPDLETEVFIHGALCYSYSGLCLLSAALRGTSGNRGGCEYLCRANYTVREANEHGKGHAANIMSMKDLATGDVLTRIRQAGVTSLKIEGRKKTPLYVAAVTNYYRKLLDGTFKPGEQQASEDDIKSIFSRPWTPFHLQNRHALGITDIHTVGHRGVEAGIIVGVVKGEPDRVRFIVKNRPLEKHDGLQVELAVRDKPYGFAIDEIRAFPQRNNDTWRHVFKAEVGTTVEISLPDNHPDIPVGARIFCSSSQAVKRSYDWESVRPALERERDKLAVAVRVSESGVEVQATLLRKPSLVGIGNLPVEGGLTVARNPERVEQTIRDGVSRLGDSVYCLETLEISNHQGLFVPSSVINEARRLAVTQLDALVQETIERRISEVQAHVKANQRLVAGVGREARWTIQIDRPYYLNVFTAEELGNIDDVVFSLANTEETAVDEALSQLEKRLGGRGRIRLAMPSVIRPDAGYVTPEGIARLVRSGWLRWQAANIGSLALLEQGGVAKEQLDITADWTLFVTNTAAAEELLAQGFRRLTLSPDDTLENWREILTVGGGSVDIPVYQDTVLAVSDVCAMASYKEFCPGRRDCTYTRLHLDNPIKKESLIAYNNRCQSVFTNEKPLNLSGCLGRLKAMGARGFRADFCWRDYSPVEVHAIWRGLLEDREVPDAWRANLV